MTWLDSCAWLDGSATMSWPEAFATAAIALSVAAFFKYAFENM